MVTTPWGVQNCPSHFTLVVMATVAVGSAVTKKKHENMWWQCNQWLWQWQWQRRRVCKWKQMVATRSGVQTQVTWAQIADPNLRITLLPQAFSQRCWASQICKRTQSSYYIALNIFFNAVHYGTANVHLKSILCGTMCLLPPNKDISENCEYCDRYLSNSTEHFSFWINWPTKL